MFPPYSSFEDIFDEEDREDIIYRLKRQFKKHPDLFGKDENAFINAAFKRYSDIPTEEVNDKFLRCEEYTAFCNTDSYTEYLRRVLREL